LTGKEGRKEQAIHYGIEYPTSIRRQTSEVRFGALGEKT
jgi:hypothetical protein